MLHLLHRRVVPLSTLAYDLNALIISFHTFYSKKPYSDTS